MLQNARDSTLSYGENPASLSHLISKWYRVLTDGWTNGQTDRLYRRTDRITVAIMRYS